MEAWATGRKNSPFKANHFFSERIWVHGARFTSNQRGFS
jgi:hypothetical protein